MHTENHVLMDEKIKKLTYLVQTSLGIKSHELDDRHQFLSHLRVDTLILPFISFN